MTSAQAPQNSGTAVPATTAYLTAPEVATILRLGTWQVVNLCRSGELPATKPGKKWLIDPAALQSYLDAGRNDQTDGAA